ncbi:hypothetical protein BD309DRAFT_966688 [Dichomitus squalens]|uniref:Uncharacterized protein n=1 Tax=Dichomitus squalens TaxID=114155 RepID=A0A4Q9NIZ7_9APHY|nr:hypothetical protein BD309DRAFT_966688 [Dichomitus squalens]TBU59610.1 hypothetical protein BD310DRAFT_924623 [Dichomitus squalens]
MVSERTTMVEVEGANGHVSESTKASVAFIRPFFFHLEFCASRYTRYVTTYTMKHANICHCVLPKSDRSPSRPRSRQHRSGHRPWRRTHATYVSVLPFAKAKFTNFLAFGRLVAIPIGDFLARLLYRSVCLIVACILFCASGRRIFTLFLTLLSVFIRSLRFLSPCIHPTPCHHYTHRPASSTSRLDHYGNAFLDYLPPCH